ncbi:MAG: peptide-methionine (S)-S-oxide reductase, partial [Rhodobacteraceae bacterium]|nr:peptide-methionine (S)-S-oxide reductase [Paracoccaceae bacterium]
GQEVVTPILAAKTFWPAEAYHQNFHETNPLRYSFYREACGRDARVRQLWGVDALILEERP